MPPITGFYAFVAGTVLFALLGSNPQMSVGADSTIAPLFAVGIARLAPIGSVRYVDLVGILAVAVGAFVALVWLLRLGWIAEFLSAPIITGFLAGVAVTIVVHQIPDLFGLAAASGSTVHRIGVHRRAPRSDQRVGAGDRSGRVRDRRCLRARGPQAPRRARGLSSPPRSSSPRSVFMAMVLRCWAGWLTGRRGSGWWVCPGQRLVAWRRSLALSRWWW